MKDIAAYFYDIILEIEDYAFLVLDADGTIKDWNKGAENLKGYSSQEIIGKNFKVFYTEKDRQKKLPEQLLKMAAEEGKAIDEGWRVRKDGSHFWGSVLITALYDDKHRVSGFLKITRDLTDKKELEEKLQQRVRDKTEQLALTENQLRYTMDNMLEGAQMHDFNWRYIYVNEALVQYSTYKKEELLGYTLMEKFPGIENTELFKIMKQCMDERTTHRFDTEFNFPNGRKAHFEMSIQPVPEGIFILSVDNTERKKAEERLQKSELHYRMLVEQSADGIFLSDALGNYVDVNPAACEMLGYSHQEFLNLHITQIIAEEEIPRLGDEVAKLSRSKIVNSEWLFKRKDGSCFPGELIGRSLPNGNLQAIVRDITEQKKAREKIMKANRLYSFLSAINQSIVHIKDQKELLVAACRIGVDIGGFKIVRIGLIDDDGKLNLMNMYGDVASTEVMQNFAGVDYYDPELRHTLTGKMLWTGKYALSNDVLNDPGLLLWRKEHIQMGVNSSITLPLKKFGKVVGAFSLGSALTNFFDSQEINLLEEATNDISFALENFEKEVRRIAVENEIKELNEQLENKVNQRTLELSKANRMMESFSYSVSHDLRSPVRAIRGFAQIIQEEYSSGFDPELKRLFDMVRKSSDRMNELIEDLLTLAKYDRLELSAGTVDMQKLFQKVSDNLKLTAPHEAVITIDNLCPVHGDISMLEQVVQNLLSNAIKYSSKKESPRIIIRSTSKKEMIEYTIADNGAGFDMAFYDKLFGAFQRLHSPNQYEGTGVGLTLVKRIIEKHGGQVWAEAKVGEGATFYFTLPCSKNN